MQNDDLGSIINDIARSVNNKVNNSINAAQYGTGLSLGTITETGLNVDSVKQEYTKGDYFILDNLKNPESITTESANGPESHNHIIKTPDNQKPIKVGDRVLVAVMGVNAVIIGRVSNG